MIDIHCHILPKVSGDDGSKTLEESLAIARKLVKAGYKQVIATPHCIEGEVQIDFSLLSHQVEALNKALIENNIELKVHRGCEILFHNEVLSCIRASKAVTLGNSRYALIELPMRELPETTVDLIKELVQNNVTPVIAHPERNRVISADPSEASAILTNGAMLQLNLCSLIGVYGTTAQKTAEMLLKAKAYHFVGTDLHNDRLDIEKALERLKVLVEEDYFTQLTKGYPQAILDNSIINHEIDMTSITPVIKLEEVKSKRKRRRVGRSVLIAVTLLAILTSGGLVYADYKIQKELEQAFTSLGVDANGDINLESLMGESPKDSKASETSTETQNTSTEATETADNKANTTVNGGGEAQNSSTETQAGTNNSGSGSNDTSKAGTDSTTATASASLKKLTLAEKAQAYTIVMGKLTPDLINHMKNLAAGGFTSAEKKEVKQIFYSNFTAEEQRFLMDLYLKGK